MIKRMGLTPDAPITTAYPPAQLGSDADPASITVLEQCKAEQVYVRDGITRSLIYNQVCDLLGCFYFGKNIVDS